MIKVHRHGDVISVRNPIDGKDTLMQNVIFVEEGRGGADETMAQTSSFLARVTGENVGLDNLRTHTQPIRSNQMGLFPIGRELPGHINRVLTSVPNLRQQEGVAPRMINGRPTYFKTWIADLPSDDVDQRVSNDILMQQHPELFANARTTVAEVTTVESHPNPALAGGMPAAQPQQGATRQATPVQGGGQQS